MIFTQSGFENRERLRMSNFRCEIVPQLCSLNRKGNQKARCKFQIDFHTNSEKLRGENPNSNPCPLLERRCIEPLRYHSFYILLSYRKDLNKRNHISKTRHYT